MNFAFSPPLCLQHKQLVWLGRSALVLVGALLLLWTPLLNGYPLIHADSGTYIWSSVIFIVPVDRPIGYSLFIRAASLVPSLWSVVAVQALGTSYLLFRTAELLLPRKPRRELFAFGILVLTILTGDASVQVGLVLADIFASWLFLAGILFVFTKRTYERVLAGFMFVVALLTHNSHIYIVLGVLLVIGAISLFRRAWWLGYRRAVAGLLILVGLASLCAVGINLYLRAGIAVGRGAETFAVNRLEQSGILIRTLDTYCEETRWVLCAYREVIRTHQRGGGWFLWSPESPLGKLGWEQSTGEHLSILRYAVQCCFSSLIQTSVVASWRQFWMVRSAAAIETLPEGMNAVLAIRRNFPQELGAFQNSAQQQLRPPYTRLLRFDDALEPWIWFAFALGVSLLTVWSRAPRLTAVWLALFVLLLVNAIIVGSVSGNSIRYQERVFWLVPYLVFVSAAALLPDASPVEHAAPDSPPSQTAQTGSRLVS